MRIVLAYMSGNPNFVGGVDQVVITRARWLAAKGHEVDIVCQGGEGFDGATVVGPGIVAHPVVVPQIPGKRTGVFHPTLGRKIAAKIRDLYASHPIDLIDIHDSPLARALRPLLDEFSIASTYTIHSATHDIPTKRALPLQRYLSQSEQTAARTVDLCLAVGEAVARAAGSTTAQGAAIAVTPNALPPDLADAFARKVVRTERKGPLRLLFAGRMNRVKGLDVLLEALASLNDPARFQLLALGGGPEDAALRTLAQERGLEGTVTFGGHISDRATLIERFLDADVYVSPTRYEALSISALEAMACGTPCVLSRIPPCEEAGGTSARYFAPDDPADLASVLATIEEDRTVLATMSMAARAQADRFVPERVLPLLEEAYAQAIRRRADRTRAVLFGKDASIAARPRVSVVIPAYNVQDFVVQAICSAQNQTVPPDEIIVADDGSSDETARRAEEAGATVLRGGRGNGSIARNRGAEAATGEILLFLDGDDWWHPYKIEMHLAAHQAHPDSSFVYDCAKVVQSSGISTGIMGDLGSASPDWRHFLDWRSWTSGSSFSVRRDRYMAIGGFNEELIALQDVDFWIRAAHADGPAKRLPVPLTFYRVLPRSVSKTPKHVARNLNAAMAGWPFIAEEEKRFFARQIFLTAARWCDLRSGSQHLASAGWPVYQFKFWKVLAKMALNSAMSLRVGARPSEGG